MLVASILVIPALIFDNPRVQGWPHTLGVVLNILTWSAFALELLIMLMVVPSRREYLRNNPILPLVVLLTVPFLEDVFDGLRILTLIRTLRLLRLAPLIKWLFSAEGIRYTLLASILLIMSGAEAFAQIEKTSFWQGLYWSTSVITSTGLSDVAARTPEGRWLAIFLMLAGLAVAAVITGAFAEKFLRPSEGKILSGEEQILQELRNLSQQVEELKKQAQEKDTPE